MEEACRRRRLRRMLAGLLFTLAFMMGAFTFRADAAESLVAQGNRHVLTGGRLVQYKGRTYYRKKNKALVKNMAAKVDGKYYYFTADGAAKTGAFAYGGAFYRADTQGRLYVRKAFAYDGKYYYFLANGQMARSQWVTIGSNKYFYGANGVMKRSTWVGNFYVGPNGAKMPGMNRKVILSRATKAQIQSQKHLIIIGASRVVQMSQAVTNDANVIYICKCGAKYDWFRDTAMPRLTGYLKLFPKSKVVIQMGNNDLSVSSSGNFPLYRNAFRKLMEVYPDAKFLFMDALPGGTKGKNARRVQFNAQLQAAFPKNYIGGYDYLMRKGIRYKSSTDHEHYSDATYRLIYQYILVKVRGA